MSEISPLDDDPAAEEPVAIAITEELDLHTFRPSEVGELLPAYFAECQRAGILTVRVVHGKGSGALREGVHRLLEQLPEVASWHWPASADTGGWGATWVWLQKDAAVSAGLS
ncbi:MAG: Smr/MutS family protein [Roseimicrobium sp.]